MWDHRDHRHYGHGYKEVVLALNRAASKSFPSIETIIFRFSSLGLLYTEMGFCQFSIFPSTLCPRPRINRTPRGLITRGKSFVIFTMRLKISSLICLYWMKHSVILVGTWKRICAKNRTLNMVRSCLMLWLIGLVWQVVGPMQVDRYGRVVSNTSRTKKNGMPTTMDIRMTNCQSDEG